MIDQVPCTQRDCTKTLRQCKHHRQSAPGQTSSWECGLVQSAVRNNEMVISNLKEKACFLSSASPFADERSSLGTVLAFQIDGSQEGTPQIIRALVDHETLTYNLERGARFLELQQGDGAHQIANQHLVPRHLRE